MPIYEFYCRKCHTLYNFFSRSTNTEKVPLCPTCKNVRLKRQMSLFARVTGRQEGKMAEDGMPPIDEAKMEKAMSMLAREADRINEDDPRQTAMLMRRLTDAAGLNLGEGAEEALRRMERGDDPEAIEHEMDHILSEEEPFTLKKSAGKGGGKKGLKPNIDETLYEL